MNLNTADVMDFFDRMGNNGEENKKAELLTKSQRKKEKQILSKYSFCPSSDIKDKLSNLKPKELNKMITNDFDKSVVMEEVGCIIGNIDEDVIGYKDRTQRITLDSSTRLNKWFTNPKQIGADSVAGIAVLADMKGSKAVIKEPRNPKDEDVIHEIFVSIMGTNLLRRSIPNFAYVYSHFLCTPSVIDDSTKQVTSFCGEGDTKVLHTVYEAIAPATDAFKIAQTQNLLQYLSMIMQIALALQVAYETIDFQHGDLHGENVLFRDVSEQLRGRYDYGNDPVEFYIPYETKAGKFYLLANGVATIIDFGRSSIKHQGELYGLNEPGVLSSWDKSYPIADLFRFFTFTLRYALHSHVNDQAWISTSIKLIKFFYPSVTNAKQLAEVIDVCDRTYGFIPYQPNIQPIDFVMHFKKVAPELFNIIITKQRPNELPILGCDETTGCPVKHKVEETLGLTSPPTANTIFDFFTVKSVNPKSLANFNYIKAMKQHYTEYKALLAEIEEVNNLPFFDEKPDYEVFDIEKFKSIKKTFNKIITLRTKFHLVENYLAIGENVAYEYKDMNTVKYFKSQLSNYRKLRNILDQHLDDAQRYIKNIEGLIKTPKGNRLFNSDKKFRWYSRVAPNYF